MRRSFALVACLVSCGPPKPSVTVPAPVVAATPAPEPGPPKEPAALAPPQPELRLPRNFLPTQYTARLVLDPTKTGFDGAIQIAGAVSERSSVIWLHGWHIAVSRAVAQQGTTEVALTVTPKGEDLLELRAAQPLDAGAWTLALDYRGELDAVNTTGAFKQKVGDDSYIFTQLEAVYARRVFPCFDEPDNKVPWKLTLDVPKQLVAVGNAPVASETTLDSGLKRVEFAPTRPLPTYLIAFGVGPFEIVDAGKTKRGTPIRIVTLARRSADAAYAAKTSARIVDLEEEWFGIPYPYDKLDMISIPLTVGFGAMENAGLITYTETLILNDPKQPSRERERRWAAVAAHEIAHQWFGDLVTCAFWDDVWLNEGFADWLETKIAVKFDPSWHDDQSELSMRDQALDADVLVSARQIHQPIQVAHDIFNVFDRITYQKGASVLNMFEHYVGPEVFQRGVREYLQSRAWGAATSADFVASISKAAGKDLTAAFGTFLDQPGAPELTATLACKDGKAELALSQRRYLPPGAPTPPAGTAWIVPVCAAYDRAGARGQACTLLDQPTGTLALEGRGCPRWVMPNAEGRGYYRLELTTAQVTALRDEAWPKLSWTERRAVFGDVAEAATTGKLPLQLALSLVPKLLAGNDRFTVPAALELPLQLDGLVPDALRPKYEYWLRATFGPGATKAGFLGKDSDTLDIESTRRALVHGVAWTARDPALIAEAVKLAAHWRDLPQSIRGLTLEIAVDARADIFDRILRDLPSEPDRSRRNEMYRALGSVRDVGHQRAALALLTDPKLDIRETLGLLFEGRGGGARHPTEANLLAAQQFFRDHEAAIMKRVPHAETAGPIAGLSRLFTSSCRADLRAAVADYVTKTFGSLPGGPRVVKQNLEAMDQCIARRAVIEPELKAWLEGVRLPKPKT